jgi:hypothetical protein
MAAGAEAALGNGIRTRLFFVWRGAKYAKELAFGSVECG